MSKMTKIGPKPVDHPTIGAECPACGVPFEAGDFTTLVALGPGPNIEARIAARDGRQYEAVAIECHWCCVTGEIE